ncbi:MAG TPA: periplasmic heavy metal sensor [Pyrinomonadaceae bacterium]|nr:periplasmic heavy metal sensor [Pyrinomonadaceae bacterium]
MTPRATTRLKIWLVVVGVFALGTVTGASLGGVYRQRGGGREARGEKHDKNIFERMRRDLNLSEEQAGQVRAILDETREEYRALRSECRPRYDAARQKGRERIRALLTPEQRQRFDAKAAERDARRGAEENMER